MMTEIDLLKEQNVDAMAWAKSFCQTLKDNPDIKIDEGFMVGWFANPMMCMYDKERSKADKLFEALQHYIEDRQWERIPVEKDFELKSILVEIESILGGD